MSESRDLGATGPPFVSSGTYLVASIQSTHGCGAWQLPAEIDHSFTPRLRNQRHEFCDSLPWCVELPDHHLSCRRPRACA